MFVNRVSASNAICAPLTWQQGDLRRPYPTDIEMRLGFLGKSDLSLNGHALQHQISANEHRNTGGWTNYFPSLTEHNIIQSITITDVPTSAQNQFAWHPSGELHMSMGASTGSVALDTRYGIYVNVTLIRNNANGIFVFSERTRMIVKMMLK